jgi:hypothetical protein
MNVLFLEHFSRQDLDSLIGELRANRPGWTWSVLPWQRLRMEALKNLPDPDSLVFEDYTRPELQEAWAAHARHLETVFEELYARQPFDVFVAPSDLFYYVRGAAAACERLSVPFVVVQKETTVSPGTMETETQVLRRHVPFLAHHMTVCSERHRDYWLAAGADPDRISVTGQPRFDWYATVPERPQGKKLLFLSYHLYAYAEAITGELNIWRELHAQTEAQLWELARRGWEIVVKPHPQQPNWGAEVRRMRSEMPPGVRRRVRFARYTEDTRRLIGETDAVVGFQTTALLEAMIAGRPVVYTGWDVRAHELQDALIPFHTYGDVIELVQNADELADTVERAPAYPRGTAGWERRHEIFVEELGPVDGRSSERVLDRLELEVAALAAVRTEAQQALRERAARARPPRRLRETLSLRLLRLRHKLAERFPAAAR